MKYFNTAGPCYPNRHYMVPAEERLPEAREYIEFGFYFVVHAPRQSGKTTTLRSLARGLTAEGHFLALCISCETAASCGDDFAGVELVLLDELRRTAQDLDLAPELLAPEVWPEAAPGFV